MSRGPSMAPRLLLLALLCLLPLLLPCSSASSPPKAIAVEIQRHEDLSDEELKAAALSLAEEHGMELAGPIGSLRGFFLFRAPHGEEGLLGEVRKEEQEEVLATRFRRLAEEEPRVRWAEVQRPLVRRKRVGTNAEGEEDGSGEQDSQVAYSFGDIKDPLFASQWHLNDAAGHHINVEGAWKEGVIGEGVVVALVDDGLDFAHPDLKDNYSPEASYDFNDNDPEPMPVLSDDVHGTRCAGEIAAVRNSVCGVGVAFGAKVGGLRILSGAVTDAMEAQALSYKPDLIHIYSNSWGPWDNGQTVEAPGPLCQKAFEQGVAKGRSGLGSVFVFASGNGGSKDNCNFDGYTNSIYTISIGAIDRNDVMPAYQELCAAQMAVTYSSNSKDYIVTTDVKNQCTNRHGGTSAAAPLASGILALVLSARPDLTWRDVQWLVVASAVKFNEEDPDWSTNGAGYHFNHRFGFGKMNATRIVEMAKTWRLVEPQSVLSPPALTPAAPIPQGDTGLASSVVIEQGGLPQPYFMVEHVTVTVDIRHDSRGELMILLTSPFGGTATLATERSKDTSAQGLRSWVFMTVKFWGENPVGKWTLTVLDRTVNQRSGVLAKWSIALYGQASTEPLWGEKPSPPVTSTVAPTTTQVQPTQVHPTQVQPTEEQPTEDKPTEEPGTHLVSGKVFIIGFSIFSVAFIGLAFLCIAKRRWGPQGTNTSSEIPVPPKAGKAGKGRRAQNQQGSAEDDEEDISLMHNDALFSDEDSLDEGIGDSDHDNPSRV